VRHDRQQPIGDRRLVNFGRADLRHTRMTRFSSARAGLPRIR
jgi:hypothetical protein